MLLGNHSMYNHYQVLSLSSILDIVAADAPLFFDISSDELILIEQLIEEKF